jgi:hypothetical protein
MPEISLTDFVDFVVRSGPAKVTKVREIRERGPYAPALDFWKPLREGIVSFHAAGSTDKRELDRILRGITDPKKNVIHHDLDWNPSVIEQRTGRLDRLGSKAAVLRQPISVYEPFLEGTQDEKMFKVVKDREPSFSVVMGQQLTLDEWSTEKLAERVPLPQEVASSLAMQLSLVDDRSGEYVMA